MFSHVNQKAAFGTKTSITTAPKQLGFKVEKNTEAQGIYNITKTQNYTFFTYLALKKTCQPKDIKKKTKKGLKKQTLANGK